MNASRDTVARFSDRAGDYARHRPHYPAALIDLLVQRCGFAADWIVADIGAGTGILTELILRHGNPVYALEPNDAMRAVAEAALAAYPTFHSSSGRSEATGLPAASIDLVVAGQAFHWFEPVATRREFQRILRPDGWVALVWNSRRSSGTPFLAAYQQMLDDFGTDYRQVDHQYVVDDAALARFFGGPFSEDVMPNRQVLDLAGLAGRVFSTSYTPGIGDPRRAPMQARLEEIFARHAVDGHVVMEYDTQLYLGRLAP